MAIIKTFRFIPTIKRKDLNPDFADYAWFSNFFNAEEIENIRSLWTDDAAINAAVNASIGQKETRDDLRRSKIMFIKPGANDWVYDRLSQACIQINGNRYKFDITGFQTELQLANYGKGDFFDWHMDFSAAESNRKLSITVQLSDPDEYEGGDLQFMINQNIVNAPREKGTAIIFPSFALHRVTPITSGSRKSIVGWIAGPPYK